MKSLISSKRVSRTALSSCETKTKKGYIKTSYTHKLLFFSKTSTHKFTHNFQNTFSSVLFKPNMLEYALCKLHYAEARQNAGLWTILVEPKRETPK